MKRYFFILIISFAACSDGFNYETLVTYKAKKSNLTANLIASGHILNGHDLDENGIVNGYIVSTAFSDTLFIQSTEYNLLVFTNKKDSINLHSANIKNYLDQLHYEKYNTDEITELEKVIKATAYGPKGTYVQGQTEFLEVVDVDFVFN
ncbi:hypothetical protein [Psychroserpens damuponensis]|uniref:hypothetical protein n=1 Tax=Psychroserpens damuponensis TaxID=943936 RepID=UPI00058EE057|nr:hypothetical protein [Psychroserpens damuponensis]